MKEAGSRQRFVVDPRGFNRHTIARVQVAVFSQADRGSGR